MLCKGCKNQAQQKFLRTSDSETLMQSQHREFSCFVTHPQHHSSLSWVPLLWSSTCQVEHGIYKISRGFYCATKRGSWDLQSNSSWSSRALWNYGGSSYSGGPEQDLTFFKAKEAVWPPRTSLTGILLRWMDLTAIGRKLPSGSGPSSKVSFSLIRPLSVVPDTTVPTPYARKQTPVTRVIQPHSQMSFRTSLPRDDTCFNLKQTVENCSKCQVPYRDRVSIIYLEFCWFFFPVTGPWRQEIKKHLQQV